MCVWRPGPSWEGRTGTPADLVAANLPAAPVAPDIYVYGPPPLTDAVTEAAAAGGVAPDRVFRERFLPT